MFAIIEKLEDKQIDQLINLYKQCWWAKDRDINDIKIMLDNSHVIGVLREIYQI